MTTTSNDHRVDIRAYAQELEADMEALLEYPSEGDDAADHAIERLERLGATFELDDDGMIEDASDVNDIMEGYALEVIHGSYASNYGEADGQSTELLLGYGGPTVRVTLDRFDRATLYHSWGKDEEDETRYEYDMSPSIVSAFVETFYPHPADL